MQIPTGCFTQAQISESVLLIQDVTRVPRETKIQGKKKLTSQLIGTIKFP